MKLTFDIPDNKTISAYECAQNVFLLMSCCKQTVFDVKQIADRIVGMAETNTTIQSNLAEIVAENESRHINHPKWERVKPSIDDNISEEELIRKRFTNEEIRKSIASR